MSATPPERPDYGTAAWGELPVPQGLVLAVFAPDPNGTSNLAVFGPLRPDATGDEAEGLLAQALHRARRVNGTVVRLPALADYSGGV